MRESSFSLRYVYLPDDADVYYLPTPREWLRHAALFIFTLCTSTLSGLMLLAGEVEVKEPSAPRHALEWIVYPVVYYVNFIWAYIAHAVAAPHLIVESLSFSATLLSILAAHEAGHYLACRRYRIPATLPFFIPAPPPLLAGTFGAFIKIRAPIPSRRALFDVAVAGPLAGFAVIICATLAALLTARPAAALDDATLASGYIVFNDPLLFKMMAWLMRVDVAHIAPNPFYFAAWIGSLVTALNLFPVGQLDGGHTTYAVFGRTAHAWIARVAFCCMLIIAPLGFFLYGAPSGILYLIFLAVLLRFGHPNTMDEGETLGARRIVIAILTLLVFALSFLPFPVSIH